MWKFVFSGIALICGILIAANIDFNILTTYELNNFPFVNPWKILIRFVSKINPYWSVATIVGIYLTYRLIKLINLVFFQYLNRVRIDGDLGYIPDGSYSMKDMAGIVAASKVESKTPPFYPNGWYAIEESMNLDVGQTKSISILGITLALYRGEDTKPRIVDAFCPHLGANLGVGGKVYNSCIECPFHGWTFDGDNGKCVKIPYYKGKMPETAKIKSYLVLEVNNVIYMWYHVENKEPEWQPQLIDDLKNGEFDYGGRTEHYVNCHIEEIPENGADFSHLKQLHGPPIMAGIDLRYMYNRFWSAFEHCWQGGWKALENDEKHIGRMTLNHCLKLFGFKVPLTAVNVIVDQIGPSVVYMKLEGSFGRVYILHSVTPIGPLKQRMVHQVYSHWLCPLFVRKLVLIAEALQVERDISVWNNKKYESKPCLVKSNEDQMIAKHRRWYSQFYSKPKSSDCKFMENGIGNIIDF